MSTEVKKRYFTYNQIHKLVSVIAPKIKSTFQPDVMVAIGGGGFIPARMLRTYMTSVPILAVGLKLYNDHSQPTATPEIVQWLDPKNSELINGKKVLIVDEVDDSRVTLEYCIELVRNNGACEIAIMVVHNKQKTKKGKIPSDVQHFAAMDIEDVWIVYPWDAQDIDNHDEQASATEQKANSKA